MYNVQQQVGNGRSIFRYTLFKKKKKKKKKVPGRTKKGGFAAMP